LFDIPGIAATVVCDLCESKVAEFMEFKRICITSNDRLANKELLKLETSIEQPTQIWCQNENEYQAKSVDDDRNHLSAIADVPNNEVTKLDKKTKFDREVCSYCGKTFLFLSQHIKSMHSRTLSNTKKYTCGLCFEKFTERSLLKVHVGSIHDGKMFHCDICGKRDKTLGGLARHIRSHSKIRPYSCELCGKLFRYSKHLFEHKLRHENNRRFSCEICSKKFFTHTEISSHRLIHANDRSFKCTECGKGFKRPDHVRSHMRIHLKDKSFACKICEKEFSFKHNMNTDFIVIGATFFIRLEFMKRFTVQSRAVSNSTDSIMSGSTTWGVAKL
ncbi:Zinc finger protein, partial [Pseudolycoriella hygida]